MKQYKNIQLVIDDKTIEVPEEMTIGMYQIIQSNPELFENNPHQYISLFTGIPFPELKNLNVDQINLIETFLSSRVEVPSKNELVLTFEHDGVMYGLENDWSKLAFGAWIDFEVYSSENIVQNINKIMAILYRPVISSDKKNPKKYKITPYKSEEIEDRAQIMLDVPVRYWLGASQFFFSVVATYIKNMKASLEGTMKINNLITKGWRKLPKVIKRRLRLDTILISPTNSLRKI